MDSLHLDCINIYGQDNQVANEIKENDHKARFTAIQLPKRLTSFDVIFDF